MILLLYFLERGLKMNKNLKKMFDGAKKFIGRNDAEILTGLALIGLTKSLWDMYKAGPKIDRIMKDAKADMKIVRPGDKEARNAVVKETVKKLAVTTAPVAISTVFTGACIIGSNRASNKKLAVMSAAYRLSADALTDLNKKMKEVVGERKAREIKDAVVKENLEKDPPTEQNTIIVTDKKDMVRCKDCHSKRYFWSTPQKLQKAILDLSVQCYQEDVVTLNDLYYLLRLEPSGDSESFGWFSKDLVDNLLPITISAQLTEDMEPCLCLDYDARLVDWRMSADW